MLRPARWLGRLTSPRRHPQPPTGPPVYSRACPGQGLPRSGSAITTRPNHLLPRRDFHPLACQRTKAAPHRIHTGYSPHLLSAIRGATGSLRCAYGVPRGRGWCGLGGLPCQGFSSLEVPSAISSSVIALPALRRNSLYRDSPSAKSVPDEETLFIGGLGTVRISPLGACYPDLHNHLLCSIVYAPPNQCSALDLRSVAHHSSGAGSLPRSQTTPR